MFGWALEPILDRSQDASVTPSRYAILFLIIRDAFGYLFGAVLDTTLARFSRFPATAHQVASARGVVVRLQPPDPGLNKC